MLYLILKCYNRSSSPQPIVPVPHKADSITEATLSYTVPKMLIQSLVMHT